MKGNQDCLLAVSEIPEPVHLVDPSLRFTSYPLARSHQSPALPETNQREIPSLSSQGLLIWLPLSFLVIYAGVSAIFVYREKSFKYLKRILPIAHKIPCTSCRFFNDNYYIKCAVHPCSALTKNAINCSDYSPRHAVDRPDKIG
ncbi:MAG: hypothetical protein MUE44_35020 [Oscillatoriaceae cyanobacterium Prado104]|jgi:hypothetical protein|nr:hypothetical protein [Oscillatoriaceae cyanobacterium Prado104]